MKLFLILPVLVLVVCKRFNCDVIESNREVQIDDLSQNIKQVQETMKMVDPQFKYADKTFPANGASYYGSTFIEISASKNYKPFVWKRIQDLKMFDFAFSTQPADIIIQGILGDCWLDAAIFQIYQYELMDEVFVAFDEKTSKHYKDLGIHLVKLYINRRPVLITVDDYVPLDDKGNLKVTSTLYRNYKIPILEKTAAKMHGSYMTMTGGYASEAFRFLLRYPTRTIILPTVAGAFKNINYQATVEERKIFSEMYEYYQRKYILTAESISGVDSEEKKILKSKYGINSNHAYPISCIEIHHSFVFILISDSNGEFGTGKYEQTTEVLERYPEIKDALLKRADGIHKIWLVLNDFLRLMRMVHYVVVEKMLTSHVLDLSHPKNSDDRENINSVTFEVIGRNPVKLYITAIQQTKRKTSKSLYNFGIALFKRNPGRLELISSNEYQDEEAVFIDADLSVGKYFVVVFALDHWNSKTTPPSYVLEFQAKKMRKVVNIEIYKFASVNEYVQLFHQYIFSKQKTLTYLNYNRKVRCDHTTNVGHDICCYVFIMITQPGGVFYYLENPSVLPVRAVGKYTGNINLQKPKRGTFESDDFLPSKSRTLINYWNMEDSMPGEYTFSLECWVGRRNEKEYRKPKIENEFFLPQPW